MILLVKMISEQSSSIHRSPTDRGIFLHFWIYSVKKHFFLRFFDKFIIKNVQNEFLYKKPEYNFYPKRFVELHRISLDLGAFYVDP